jgi:hypothetical protein
MKKGAEKILAKHGCLFMKDDYKALFEELEAYYKPAEVVKNNAGLSDVSGCFWCDNPLIVGQVLEVLPDNRGIAHEKCAEEFYGSKLAED